jgi:RimJ/RimL family protein N-acetyltransferase
MNTPTTGRPVLLHTKHFLLRSLKPSYASQRWLSWLKDPEVMDPLNAPVREVPFRDLMAHIATADDNKLYMIGIFDLESKVQIGYYNIVCEIDQAHRRANFNVVIGEKSWWGKDVINETRAALLDEFFNNRGIEKATGNPLARNFPAIFNYKSQGWRHEGTLRAHSISVRDGSPLDQYLFGLTKDEWFGSAKKEPQSATLRGDHAHGRCSDQGNGGRYQWSCDGDHAHGRCSDQGNGGRCQWSCDDNLLENRWGRIHHQYSINQGDRQGHRCGALMRSVPMRLNFGPPIWPQRAYVFVGDLIWC